MLASQSYKPNYDEWKVVFWMLNTTLFPSLPSQPFFISFNEEREREAPTSSQWVYTENYRDFAKKKTSVFSSHAKIKMFSISPAAAEMTEKLILIWFTEKLRSAQSSANILHDEWLTTREREREIYRVPNGLWLLPIQSSALQPASSSSLHWLFTVIIFKLAHFAPILSTHPTGYTVLSFHSFPPQYHNVLRRRVRVARRLWMPCCVALSVSALEQLMSNNN